MANYNTWTLPSIRKPEDNNNRPVSATFELNPALTIHAFSEAGRSIRGHSAILADDESASTLFEEVYHEPEASKKKDFALYFTIFIFLTTIFIGAIIGTVELTLYHLRNQDTANGIELSAEGTQTQQPSIEQTLSPTQTPTIAPSFTPTGSPSESPSMAPSMAPSVSPTFKPSTHPTSTPTMFPTAFSLDFHDISAVTEFCMEKTQFPESNSFCIDDGIYIRCDNDGIDYDLGGEHIRICLYGCVCEPFQMVSGGTPCLYGSADQCIPEEF